jgi:hypothetical protein
VDSKQVDLVELERECVDWIQLQASVKTVMKLQPV